MTLATKLKKPKYSDPKFYEIILRIAFGDTDKIFLEFKKEGKHVRIFLVISSRDIYSKSCLVTDGDVENINHGVQKLIIDVRKDLVQKGLEQILSK